MIPKTVAMRVLVTLSLATVALMAIAPGAMSQDSPPANATKKDKKKKPGNETVDKAAAKERKALAKAIEKQGGSQEQVK